MIYSTLLIAASAFSGLVAAQSFSDTGNNTYTIDPNTVSADTRTSWCRAEQNSCPEICGGQYASNTCDSTKLTYNCTCLSGNTPNISSYSQTLPALECEEWKGQCVQAHPNDLAGQNFCLSVVCGQKNATAALASASASSAGSSASSTGSSGSGSSASSTGTSSGSSSSATSSSAAAAMAVAKSYGTPALAAGFLAIFGLAL